MFGERIREFRRRAGLSQGELGKQLGVEEGGAQSFVSRVERGLQPVSLKDAARMAEVLNLSDDDWVALRTMVGGIGVTA